MRSPIVSLFRGWLRRGRRRPGPDREERRGCCRYPAAIPGALLCWYSNGILVEEPIDLIDVSLQGCQVQCRSGPGQQPGLQLELKCPGIAFPDGIEGELVATRRSAAGTQEVRIRFKQPLSFDAFKAFVYGPEPLAREPSSPEHEWDIYWR
jgi:hypothetical protein